MSLFNINELNRNKPSEEAEQSGNAMLCRRFLSTHLQRVESIKDLCGSFPDPDSIHFIWTVSSFNAFTFIPYIIKYAGTIENLIISTYSINTRIVDSFFNYIEKGKILNAQLFISESLKYRMPKVVDYLNHMTTTHPGVVKVGYEWNHSKVTLMHVANNYFVVEGSGNWSENAKHEQYIFCNSKEVYEFRAKWILDRINTGTN